MIKKGIVSTVDNNLNFARVIFKEIDNSVSYELKISNNINLMVGDIVLVAFWRNNLKDGAIIAKI